MNIRYKIIATFLVFLFAVNSKSQNLFPNPDFETYSSCPTSLSQSTRAIPWGLPTAGSSDYHNCTYYGNGVIDGGSSSGTGGMAGWGWVGQASCSADVYCEYIGATLLSPMVNGTAYDVSLDIRIDGTGTATGPVTNCVDFGFYFYSGATPTPPAGSVCALSTVPQAALNSGSLSQGAYQNFTFNFTSAGNYTDVLIGAFKNANTAGCLSGGTGKMYFNYDNLSLVAGIALKEKLISFRGENVGKYNKLFWEINNYNYDNFTIENSADGISFNPIGDVSGDSENDNNYVFIDNTPFLKSHYRLKMKDTEGKFHFSEIISIEREGANSFTIENLYPNPTQGIINIELNVKKTDEVHIEITNVLGQVVMYENVFTTLGSNTISLNIADIKKGIYFMSIKNSKGQNVVKPIIIN